MNDFPDATGAQADEPFEADATELDGSDKDQFDSSELVDTEDSAASVQDGPDQDGPGQSNLGPPEIEPAIGGGPTVMIDPAADAQPLAPQLSQSRRETDDVEPLARWDGPPQGIRRAARDGTELVDAMAGRSSVFGFGFEPVIEAIQQAARQYLGDAAELIDHPGGGEDLILRQLQELLGDSRSIVADSLYLTSSAEMAVETAIELSRKRNPDPSYRVVTVVGSDHGRSGVCRIASGRPELHQDYGPMMAGFAHVPVGDIDALAAVVDEQTCAVMLSPIDVGDAARPITADYLLAVRELCDRCDLALIFDESRIGFAASGSPLTFAAIADVNADAVILGGGLFGGLPGGAVIASERLTGSAVLDTGRFPMLAAVASATLQQIIGQQLLTSSPGRSDSLVAELAELAEGFEFVRDLHDLGMTIGIVLDIGSAELVTAAGIRGLRLEAAGETAVRMQLPLVLSDEDRDLLFDRLRRSMEAIERATAETSV